MWFLVSYRRSFLEQLCCWVPWVSSIVYWGEKNVECRLGRWNFYSLDLSLSSKALEFRIWLVLRLGCYNLHRKITFYRCDCWFRSGDLVYFLKVWGRGSESPVVTDNCCWVFRKVCHRKKEFRVEYATLEFSMTKRMLWLLSFHSLCPSLPPSPLPSTRICNHFSIRLIGSLQFAEIVEKFCFDCWIVTRRSFLGQIWELTEMKALSLLIIVAEYPA